MLLKRKSLTLHPLIVIDNSRIWLLWWCRFEREDDESMVLRRVGGVVRGCSCRWRLMVMNWWFTERRKLARRRGNTACGVCWMKKKWFVSVCRGCYGGGVWGCLCLARMWGWKGGGEAMLSYMYWYGDEWRRW